jgi:hypothetical protein
MRIEVRYRRIPWRLAFIRAGRERKSEHAREERRPTRSVRSPREQKGECRWARSDKQKQPPQRAAGFSTRRPPSHRFASAFFLPAAAARSAACVAFTSPVTFVSKQKNYLWPDCSLFRLYIASGVKTMLRWNWNWIHRCSAWVFEERVIGTIFRSPLRRSNQLVGGDFLPWI